jgi:hypothetical protein
MLYVCVRESGNTQRNSVRRFWTLGFFINRLTSNNSLKVDFNEKEERPGR